MISLGVQSLNSKGPTPRTDATVYVNQIIIWRGFLDDIDVYEYDLDEQSDYSSSIGEYFENSEREQTNSEHGSVEVKSENENRNVVLVNITVSAEKIVEAESTVDKSLLKRERRLPKKF